MGEGLVFTAPFVVTVARYGYVGVILNLANADVEDFELSEFLRLSAMSPPFLTTFVKGMNRWRISPVTKWMFL